MNPAHAWWLGLALAGGALASVLTASCGDRGASVAGAAVAMPEAGTFVALDRAKTAAPADPMDAGVGWVQAKEVVVSGLPSVFHGASVAISGDIAVVGTPVIDADASVPVVAGGRVLARSGSTWIEQQALPVPAGAIDFGAAVATTGDTVFVGAPGEAAVYVYTASGGVWSVAQRLAPCAASSCQFGTSLAVEGGTLVVGALGPATAYVFAPSGTGTAGATWSMVQTLKPGYGAGSFFGASVAISGDVILVGEPGGNSFQGQFSGGGAHVFELRQGQWWFEQTLSLNTSAATDRAGASVGVAGDYAFVGAPGRAVGSNYGQGAVDFYVRYGSTFALASQLSAGGANESFGGAIAASAQLLVIGDGADAVGSNLNQGAVYTFVPSAAASGATWTPTERLTASDGVNESAFGVSVAIADGHVLVGANGAGGTGVAYLEAFGPLNGSACSSGAACGSGNCASGVCCDSTCTGGCQSCTTQGTCVPLATGNTGEGCGPYLCTGADGCPTRCAQDRDCVIGNYCSGGQECVPQQPGAMLCTAPDQCLSGSCVNGICQGAVAAGKACASGDDCASSWCADGVCCDSPCAGQCQACDLPGSVGRCSPVTSGAPRGERPACAGGGGPCSGACRGDTNAAGCTYPTTSCGSVCQDARTSESTCDGQGACVARAPHACNGNLGCADAVTCKAACETDDDCVAGFYCKAGACQPKGLTCLDAQTSLDGSTGQVTPCAPFVCDEGTGACLGRCATVADCLSPNVCDPAVRQCIPPPSTAADPAGPACSAAGPPARSSGPAAILALVACVAASRRRRRP